MPLGSISCAGYRVLTQRREALHGPVRYAVPIWQVRPWQETLASSTATDVELEAAGSPGLHRPLLFRHLFAPDFRDPGEEVPQPFLTADLLE